MSIKYYTMKLKHNQVVKSTFEIEVHYTNLKNSRLLTVVLNGPENNSHLYEATLSFKPTNFCVNMC